MKTILITAYAINPYKGSEDGTGWNLVTQIARFNNAIAITRENNKPAIEKFLEANKENTVFQNLQFQYFDLPYWMRFWKKGERGAMLYFYLWQMFMPLFIVSKKLKFDIVHNLNFHNDWTPSFLWILGKPFVWGPIGHHPNIPKEYVLVPYGRKNYIKSQILWLMKNIFWKLDPFLRLTLWKADKIICINSGVEKIHKINPQKSVRMAAVGCNPALNQPKKEEHSKFIFLSVGRLVSLKGFDITIRAFRQFYLGLDSKSKNLVQLQIVGQGPLKNWIKKEIEKLDLQDVVVLHEWVEQSKMHEIYQTASVFFYPSHEGAGMVVPEALSHGLPVVCFDNEGPGEFVDSTCSLKVAYSKYDKTIHEFADILEKIFEDKKLYEHLSDGALRKFESTFSWHRKGEFFKSIYENINLSL